MRQVVGRRHDDAARLVSTVEQIVKRRKELRLRGAETEIDVPLGFD